MISTMTVLISTVAFFSPSKSPYLDPPLWREIQISSGITVVNDGYLERVRNAQIMSELANSMPIFGDAVGKRYKPSDFMKENP